MRILQEVNKHETPFCATLSWWCDPSIFALHAEIKNELKKKDDEFVKTLKGQAEDVDTLLQYMSRQFVEMQNAFKEEMDEIEGACLQVSCLKHGKYWGMQLRITDALKTGALECVAGLVHRNLMAQQEILQEFAHALHTK